MPRHDAEYEYGTIVKGTTLNTPTITIEHNTTENYETLALNNGIEIERNREGEIIGYTYVQTVSELTDDGYQDRVYRVNMVPEKDSSSTADNVIINYKPSGAYTIDQERTYSSGGTSVIIDRDEYLTSSLKSVGINLDLGQTDPEQIQRLWDFYSDTTDIYNYGPNEYPEEYGPIAGSWDKCYGMLKQLMTGDEDSYKYFTRAESFAKILQAAAYAGIFDFEDLVEDDPETKAIMLQAVAGDMIKLTSPFDEYYPAQNMEWLKAFLRPMLYATAIVPSQNFPSDEGWETYCPPNLPLLIPEYADQDVYSATGEHANIPLAGLTAGGDAQTYYYAAMYTDATTDYEIQSNYPQYGYAVIDISNNSSVTLTRDRQWITNHWQAAGTNPARTVANLVYDQATFINYLSSLDTQAALTLINSAVFLCSNCEFVPGGSPGVTHDPTYIHVEPEDDPDDILRKVEDQYPDWWDDTLPEPTYDPVTNTTPIIRYIPIGVGTPSPRVDDPVPTVITGGYPEWIHATVPTIPGIPEPKPETIAPVSSNRFWTIYKPTDQAMDALGAKLWDQNVIDMLLQTFQNPTDGILGYGQVYFNPSSTHSGSIIMGNYDSQVSAPILDTNHYVVNYSKTVTIPRYYNDYRDYTETEVSIYLPFVGIEELDPLETVGYTLKLRYDVDLLTGTCVAQLVTYPTEETEYKDSQGAIAHYMFSGNCMVQLPITARDRSQLLTGILSGAVGVANAAGGNIIGGVSQAVGGAIQAVQGLTGKVSKVTSFSANVGALTEYKTPYVTVKRKIPADPVGYDQYYGDPACTSVTLGQLSGFVRVKDVFLNIPGATDTEIAQIDALLHSGVRL